MSSSFPNSQLDAESMRPYRFVEFFFSSIDLLIERLVFLRRNVSGPIPSMENSVWHRIRGPQVSSDERIQILNEFYVRVIVSHLKRVHLCRVIRLIGPYITLDAAYGRYRRAANYLILYDFQLLRDIA
ncbi:hypothetical protein SSS_05175 [Sarcoptes scabiei]|uniref:Uncharacterized protein n=1 Tax=Sarcoptes scabiei TaxID=52283 RepID=A0A834RFM5_SARSC|nr:hypothetical protein SSS_05175 [Sarcoptes scabiei]